MNSAERRSIGNLPGIPLERGHLAMALGMGLVLAVGYLGQRALDRQPASLWGWALLLAGGAVFALLNRRQAVERQGAEPAGLIRAPRLVPLGLAVLLAVLAFPGFGGNRFRPLPTVAWLGALALLYFAFQSAAPAGRPAFRVRLADGVRLSWHTLALVGILLVAAVLRLRELDAIPREMGVDMPLIYQNAREIMQGQFMVFCPRYPGRESLFHYLLAAYGAVFGLSYFALKFVSALVGVATVAVVYGLGRSLYDRHVGLVAAAFLAVSKWHVILSRSGYRASLMPLAVALVLWTTVRALRRRQGADFWLAGLALGLGLYTYNAFLVVPPLLLAALALELARRGRQAFRGYAWGMVALALAALVAFLPLGRYALEQPQAYLFRVATRVTGTEVPLPADLLRVFLGNLGRAAAMFNQRGDGVYYANVPYQRQLGVISGVLLPMGLAYALVRWRRGHNLVVLVFLAGLLLPTALSVAFPQEVPNAVRASGVLVPVYLLVALPPALAGQRLAGLWRGSPLPATAIPPSLCRRWPRLSAGMALVLLLLPLAGFELGETRQRYFRDYVQHLPGRNYAITLEMARVLDDFAPQGPAYIKVWPHWFDGNALRAQLRIKEPTWDWELADLDPAAPPLSTVQGRFLVIVHPGDVAMLEALYGAFPRGVAIEHYAYDGRVAFVTFYGER